MKYLRYAVGALLLLALFSPPALSEPCSSCLSSGGDAFCGPKCLLEVCSCLDVTATIEELVALSGADENGCTMAELQQAAQRKGLHAVGVKIGTAQLAAVSELAICYLWGNHFVVVQANSTGIVITDPSADLGRQYVPLHEFAAAYSGFALLVSKEEIALPDALADAPDVRLGEYWCDLGKLDEGVEVRRMISFRNAGTRDLVVSSVRPTCNCIKVEKVTTNVPPGGTGSVSFTYETEGLSGAQAQSLYVESNDPVSPLVVVDIGALVSPARLLVSKRRINFGAVNAHARNTRELFIKDPGDGSLDVIDVSADSPHLKVLLGSTRSHEADISQTVFPVQVTLEADVPVGPFEGAITIISNHPKEPELRIPVIATIVGDIGISPESVFLGFVTEGDAVSRSVLLRPLADKGFAVRDVSTSSDCLSVEVCSAKPDPGYVLTVILSGSSSPGLIEEEVLIHTDSPRQPTVVVPVYALVQGRSEVSETHNRDEHAASASASLNATTDHGEAQPRAEMEGTSPVRVYVFRSEGCSDCEIVSADRLDAIASGLGCEIDVRYFDVDELINWRKLVDLEKKYEDINNEVPVVFIGTDVLGGILEVGSMLEPAIAAAAAEGGTDWPDDVKLTH